MSPGRRRPARPQAIAALVLLLGLAAFAYGLLQDAAAALPYPDPTPELLLGQARQIESAQAVSLVGGAAAVASLLVLRRLRRRSR